MEVVLSDWFPVTSEVPQGSIVGPLMLLAYVNDASDCIQSNPTVALYADESKLYRPIDRCDTSGLI